MNLSHFFVDRPIFATVLALFVTIIGGAAYFTLPVAQYPDIAPPTIVVSASYPGASAEVVSDTVSTPLEQEINGVENMLYMNSQATADGNLQLTITFALGTDLDISQVLVQNRVSIAEPKLPEEVRRLGITVKKNSPDMLIVIHLSSPDASRDQLYISNYATLQVRDELARLDGVGDVRIFGARDYAMRIWLDPDKVSARNLTAGEVVAALQAQNVQVASGVLNQPPTASLGAFQLNVETLGRLVDPRQFANIVVRNDPNGRVTRIRDVGRVELGAQDYGANSYLDERQAVALLIFQRPGSNALATADRIKASIRELARSFPSGLQYDIVYNPTEFIAESVREVQKTIFEAVILVVIVVILFLQTWRASIIPIVAIPVSLIGTFAVLTAFGFSLNNLSLFGLVLAIGIVVDDAIVVVEAVEHNIELGMPPKEATEKAMDQVGGAVVAIAIVLSAVFIPTAFISGITGQFYRQFALTIAVSTLISAFNSLTLSPALCAILLQPRGTRSDWLTRVLDRTLGWFFRGFNRVFGSSTEAYSRTVGRLLRLSVPVLVVYFGLLVLTYLGFTKVPTGFIPTQDKGYIAMYAQLPDAASLERTGAVIDQISKTAREIPGIRATIDLAGLNPITFATTPNVGTIFVILDEFHKRKKRSLSSDAIVAELRKRCGAVQEAFIGVFPPPAVQGLG